MKKSFIVAGILAWALWQGPGAVWAQGSGGDDILSIEERKRLMKCVTFSAHSAKTST